MKEEGMKIERNEEKKEGRRRQGKMEEHCTKWALFVRWPYWP